MNSCRTVTSSSCCPLTEIPESKHRGLLPVGALLLLLLALFLGGCSSRQVAIEKDVQPVTAKGEIPEEELLNVAIRVFEPGTLPEDPDERLGLSEEIRQAEAVFLPVQLKYTLQRSGYWGSVWVVPHEDELADLMISGSIEESDGRTLSLKIKAQDSTGEVWIDKTYTERAEASEIRQATMGKKDAFQDLFNAISNDLIERLEKLDATTKKQIRTTTELRYAASMAEDSFARYLAKDEDGRYRIEALPAENDPMLARIRAIRARDEMLMDTLSGYYDNYYADLWAPYQNWRKYRSEELAAIDRINDEAFKRQVLGFAAIAGAVALGAIGGQDAARMLDPLRSVMVVGGAMAVYSGYQKRKEADMNKGVLEELGESFASDARPLVLEVNGEVVRLTGTARQQYEQWREILKTIYLSETGFEAELPIILGPEEAGDSDSPGADAASQDTETVGTAIDKISSGGTITKAGSEARTDR